MIVIEKYDNATGKIEEVRFTEKYYASDIGRMRDVEAKAKWVEALRSGKFAQGKNKLRAGDRYCCLGVYCEVMEVPKVSGGVFPGGRKLKAALQNEDVVVYGTLESSSPVSIPASYAIELDKDSFDWYETSRITGHEEIFCCVNQVTEIMEHHTLPMLNDSGIFNFNQIADIVNYFL